MSEHTANANELKEAIANIRNDFFKVYEKNIADNEFHEADLKRLRENDGWVRSFHFIGGRKHEPTLNSIKDALKWRKDFGVNDFLSPNPLPFPEEYLTEDGIVVKSTDKQGVPLLTLHVKKHRKGERPHDLLCRYIAYNFEKYYKFGYEHELVIVFNLNGAGYSNMDMDLIRFVVNCLMYYYPRIAGYTVVLNMPFVFEAAWRIIKLWLSPGVSNKIKFVNKTSIREFIEDDEYLNNL